MAATLSKGYTFGATETVTNAKLHALVDDASISGIANADIAADALIDSSKINFTLSDYVTLAGDQTITGTKTFSNTQIFSTPLANTNIAAITQADKVSGSSFYALASCISGAGKLPRVNQALQDINALLPTQTDNSGKFLTTNGSSASWGIIAQDYQDSIYNVVAYANTEREITDAGAYVKVKEITLDAGGTLHFYVDAKHGNPSGGRYGYVKVYRNGSPVGSEVSFASGTYATLDLGSISGWSSGDKAQLYWYMNPNLYGISVKNFKIYGFRGSNVVNTD